MICKFMPSYLKKDHEAMLRFVIIFPNNYTVSINKLLNINRSHQKMETPSSSAQGKRNISAADMLKSRLFEKGVCNSSMSTFKSPLLTDYANRMLLVNLNSSNSSKFSPKVIRKQVAGLPQQGFHMNEKQMAKNKKVQDRLKTTSYQKLGGKQTQFLEQLQRQTKKSGKAQTASNFYHSVRENPVQIQQHRGESELIEFKRTKQLVQKLTGKQKCTTRDQIRPNNLTLIKQDKFEVSLSNQLSKSRCEQTEITLQSYIRRALKNQQGLEQFLYLATIKDESELQKQEDPYQLFVVEYDTNKQIEEKLNRKYYTVSKKGLCYYVNSKPVEFIELQEWMSEKQNYQKIKNLNFFNRFRKWKTIKMWRKIVLRHSIQECSKNLQEKLFFLNPTMRHCLFQIQQINLELGENFIILANNQDSYSLQNFKAVQESNKRKTLAIIQQSSQKSRASVRKCFDENLRNLRENMKQKQQTEDKAPSITSHINLKDSAFQALGFPPKMSYENRSRLRKMAGKFIRFAYLIDMVHTAGLARHFRAQLSQFIFTLSESQNPTNLQIMMTSEDKNSSNSPQTQHAKLFHVKLILNQTPISSESITLTSFAESTEEFSQSFNPLYDIKVSKNSMSESELNPQRQYCPEICDQWLLMIPRFEDIFKEVTSKIKQSLECLKQFERWSKHREIEKFINILEEWDDVVSQSREVTENQYLDPVSIIPNFQNSLNEIKMILSKSLETINCRIKKEFTQFLNMYWQQQRVNLQLFRSPDLQFPAETIEKFLKYITSSMGRIQKEIPYRIRLSAFEINLTEIRAQLLRKAEATFYNFKEILPEVVEERTKYVNDWLNKYINQICKKSEPQFLNIDVFVSKIKNIREAQQTFDKKKQLCLDLTAIEQIMETYKFNIKKKKDLESDTLKLKEMLDTEINSTFEESFKKQAQFYSREVHKNYLPCIVKDVSKLSVVLRNPKFISLGAYDRNNHDLLKEIEQIQKKYEELAQRNSKCSQYQQILNQFHGVQHEQFNSFNDILSKVEEEKFTQNQIPSHLEELLKAREWIECLKKMWEMFQKWNSIVAKYYDKAIKSLLEDKDILNQVLTEDTEFIKIKLKGVLGTNEVVSELIKKMEIFSKHLPIVVGLNNNLSETHWQQINELVRKNSCSITLDSQKLITLLFSDFVKSGIGQFKDQFQAIFVKASNQIKLQLQYEEIQKKWKNYSIKTKVQGKFVVICDEKQHASLIELVDQAMKTLTEIFSNPYSIRLQLGILTIQSISGFLETYQRWMSVQKKLLTYDRICRSIDLKKISEANSLQNCQKQYKAIFKILLPRNIDSSFNIIKLVPSNNATINEKFMECERLLGNLEGSIKNMLQEYRRNCPIYYQLEDSELLRVVMEMNSQQNTSSLAGLIDEFICQRFLEGVVKQIKIEGERITSIVSIDGENLAKSDYPLSPDLSNTLSEIIEAVSQYTRRMLKSCKNKSQEASLYEMVDEFNIQFLLAISKVDFSNYTGISIENRQDNSESLKQYWKIMVKDTKNGIRKLKEKRSGNLLAYENLILQSLIHQTILQQLVNANIRCANEYEWIKYLRFYWEDNEESNVNIRKMHVNLRYGKEYIGSNSKVLVEASQGTKNQYQSLDMVMSVIRNSESYCYFGNYERLRNFTNCIAHRLQKIYCTKQMSIQLANPLKMLFKTRGKTDCCYFVENAHLLSDLTISQILGSQNRNSPPNILRASSIKLDIGEHVGGCYNPIFLHFPVNQNSLLRVNKLQYRSVSMVSPSNEFLVCYIYLMNQVISSHMICQGQQTGSQIRNGSRAVKQSKSEFEEKLVESHKETVKFGSKIFDLVAELEPTENNKHLCVESFLQSAKHRICGLIRAPTTTENGIDNKILKLVRGENEPSRTPVDLHSILIEMLMEYIQPFLRRQNFIAISQYVTEVYPQLDLGHHADPPLRSKIQFTILLGYKDCLSNCLPGNSPTPLNTNQINLAQYSAEELYGYQSHKGLLHRIIYQSHSDSDSQPRNIVINGVDQKLVVYLSALIGEENISKQIFRMGRRSPKTVEKSESFHKQSPLPTDQNPRRVFEDLIPFMFGDTTKNTQFKTASDSFQALKSKNGLHFTCPLSIEIRACQLSHAIDPKLLTQFRISAAIQNFGGGWNYLEQRVQRWADKVCSAYSKQEQKCDIFRLCLQKFYHVSIKGLWKDMHKICQPEPSQKSQHQFESHSVLTEGMINLVRDFLNFLYTLLPSIFGSISSISTELSRLSFQKTVAYASIYSLCHVYRPVIDVDLEYIKFQNVFDKLQAEGWLGISESERIKPADYEPPAETRSQLRHSSKKRFTIFDYIFDGVKLTPLIEYCLKNSPERMIERGEFYLTNELIHLNLITQRTFQSGEWGMLLVGGANSGKSSFCKIFKAQHFEETAHLTVYACNKNKRQVYNKICKVLSLSNLTTIGPKINYSRSLIVVDDLSMPSQHDNILGPENEADNNRLTQLGSWLAGLIKYKALITPANYQKYKLGKINFVLNHTTGRKNCPLLPDLEECTIRYEFGGDCNIRKIFGEILKANVLDPDIQEGTFSQLVQVAFDIYQEIYQLADTLIENGKTAIHNSLSLQILKRMALFTAHLRFKQNSSSLNELTRFWAFLIKDNLEVHCANYGHEFTSLASVTKTELPNEAGKSIFEYLKLPIQQLLYSHLYVKQQVYGNGKEVQYYGEIRKLYNSINQTIHDYNATESKHRYGYYFGLIAIDELINKIVKISNMLLTGDYAIFTRRGSEVGALIRLVSFILGFNYKERNGQRIIDTVRETIIELTKVSLYLISVKIDDSNIQQFLDYYDCDFQAEVVGSLQAEDLHFLQASGAFDFGIGESENHYTSESATKAIQAWQQKNQQKPTPTTIMKQPSGHSHTNSKEQLLESKAKFHCAQEQTRFNKLSLRQLNKMKRSIRLVYEFQQLKYLKHGERSSHIPQHILSQLNVDFFHEYPRQSIIRFSEESLGMSPQGERLANEDSNIIGSAKDKFHILFEIYEKIRAELGLALNEYEECHRLYWYLVGNLSNDIKQNVTKYELIFDTNQKLQEIIAETALAMELKWEEKIQLSARVNQIKDSQYQDTQEKTKRLVQVSAIESQLSEINTSLQELTQKRSLCEKVSSFFKPTLPQFKRRWDLLQDLASNGCDKLKINCLVIASYFTYLSKLPFQSRKPQLKRWYQECPSLCKISASQRLKSVSQFFSLVTEEYMIINKQNEPYYENMMIILNSSRAVLIRDNKNKGRNWIASFDDSFASVCESSADYLQKLEEYLAAGRNIFLEITNQQTLNNSLSNEIHNLIFMEQNANTVKIGEVEYNVSSKTKVFIVVAPHIRIPEQILNENLYIVYEQRQSDLLMPLEHQIMLANNGQKYGQFLEYRKRQQCITNECYNLQIPLANVVFDEIYADIDNLDNREDRPEDEEEIKKLSVDEKKTKEQLLQRMNFLAKVGALDKHQERFDRYFVKKKQLEEVKDKISNMDLMSQYNHIRTADVRKSLDLTPLEKVLNVIKKTYKLIGRLRRKWEYLPQISLYYEVVLQGIKQGLVVINLAQFQSSGRVNDRCNVGMFALFVLRQWGQSMDRSGYFVLALCIMVIIDMEMGSQSDSGCHKYIQALQQFVGALDTNSCPAEQVKLPQSPSPLLVGLTQYMTLHSYSLQCLQAFLIQQIVANMDPEFSEQATIHNSVASARPTNKANKLDQFIVKMPEITNHKNWEQINDLLKHIIVLTGKVPNDSNDEECPNATDSEIYASSQYRKMILKLIENEPGHGNPSNSLGVVEIKNAQSFDNEIKKVLHDKTSILLPIIKTSFTPLKTIQKSESLLASLLIELTTKYSLHDKAQTKSKLSDIGSSQTGNRNKLSSQQTDMSGNHGGLRIHEDFRIYVYHYDLQEVTQLVANALNMDAAVVRERVFIRNVSNNMILNCQFSKLLRVKTDAREKVQENPGQSQKNSMYGPTNMKNNQAMKTKRQILHEEEKEKEKELNKTKQTSAVPSMRNLEQQNHNQTYSGENPQNSMSVGGPRTNKAITNQPLNHFSSLPPNPLSQYTHKVCNMVICYLQEVIALKTGQTDWSNNFYNKWFLSDTYFNGMEKLLQPISADNQSWNACKTASTICKVFLSSIINSPNFYFQDHPLKFLRQLISKMEDNCATAIGGTVKPSSTTSNEDKPNTQLEGEKVIQFIRKAIQEDLGCMKQTTSQGTLSQVQIQKAKIEAQLLHFESSWLRHLRQFLGLTPKILKMKINLDSESEPVVPKKPEEGKQTLNKRGTARRFKNPSFELHQTKTKSSLQAGSKRPSLKQVIGMASEQQQCDALGQKRPWHAVAKYLFQKDQKVIEVKSNLIRKSIEQSMKMDCVQQLPNNTAIHLFPNVQYDLVFLTKGYIPSYIRSYLRSIIPCQSELYLKNLLKKMAIMKIENQRQKTQIKNSNFAIDFGARTNPISIIKAYMCCQFEERVTRDSLGIMELLSEQQYAKIKDDPSGYYCVCFSLTADEMKEGRFIRLKNLWAVGWRLSSDSTCEMTQQQKVTLLSNVYIAKKNKPGQQMGTCEILLIESQEYPGENIKVCAFTKKSQGQKRISKLAYLKSPKQ